MILYDDIFIVVSRGCISFLHMHTHVTATAAYQKKAQIYLDPSALLIKKLLMSRVNKSLAPRRCST